MGRVCVAGMERLWSRVHTKFSTMNQVNWVSSLVCVCIYSFPFLTDSTYIEKLDRYMQIYFSSKSFIELVLIYAWYLCDVILHIGVRGTSSSSCIKASTWFCPVCWRGYFFPFCYLNILDGKSNVCKCNVYFLTFRYIASIHIFLGYFHLALITLALLGFFLLLFENFCACK